MNAISNGEPASKSTPQTDPKVGGSGETRVVAGVLVPDTPLITSAIEYARENSEPYLFNHVMRSWLFTVSLGQLNQTAHDSEVLGANASCRATSGHRSSTFWPVLPSARKQYETL